MKKVLMVLSSLLLLAGMVESTYAIGRLYGRLPNNENSPIYNLRMKTQRADVTIQDQLAITHVDQEFANDTYSRLEGFYVFQLPEGAYVNEMYLWINGVRTSYVVKKKQDAIIIYKDIVRKLMDPAILQQLGPNLFQLQIFPIEPRNTRRIEIVYFQPLTYLPGRIQYTYPLDMTDYTSAAIEQVSISINIKSQFPIVSVGTSVDQSATAVVVSKITDYNYTVAYGVEKVTFAKDFIVEIAVDRNNNPFQLLTYSAPQSLQESPYFILWAALPDSLKTDTVKTRDLTFVADVSSSMEGDRIKQLKDALNSFVDLLTDKDRFNIITFSTGVQTFRPDLVDANVQTKQEARLFVSQIVALGLTNIESALQQSLQQSFRAADRSSILFFTDGDPTWGETNIDSIAAKVGRWNKDTIGIYTIGVDSKNSILLNTLAYQSGAFYTFIAATDSMYLKIKDVYRKAILPSVKNISLSYSTVNAYDIHPTPIPNCYAGDQVYQTGRYLNGGISDIILNGTSSDISFNLSGSVVFPDTNSAMIAVARFWAAHKIQALLDLIKRSGELKELVDQVIALSIRHSILTPYTAFLVVEPGFSGVSDGDPASQPVRFVLEQNYPNPFNPSTTIRYVVPASTVAGSKAFVKIVVYNILGEEVKILLAQEKSPGTFSVVWDGTDSKGVRVPSGMYFYRLTANEFSVTKSMTLLK
jgi:Ca-activated chloride channel family protein